VAENIADLTLMHLRRMDQNLARVLEVLERHETRMSRVERDLLEGNTHLATLKRDVGEVRSDQVLVENRMLTRLNEIFEITRRVDDHERRLSILEEAT
jgi:hypothetical protein